MLQTFNIEINNDFHIRCNEMNCIKSKSCTECPGDMRSDFWDKEFVGDENIQINNNDNETEEQNEVTAFTSGEISW